MAKRLPFTHGDTEPILMAVDSATVIEIGDAVYLDTDDAKPASDLAWNTNLATTQEDFHDVYLGVSMQRSEAGDTKAIRVATGAVMDMPAVSAAYEVGDLVGLHDGGSGTALLDATVVAVATENLAIGRIDKTAAAGSTRVRVRIESTIIKGGPQAPA